MYSFEEGVQAVRMARDVLDRHVTGEEDTEYTVPESFLKKAGAFVTLQLFPAGMLRGCIGYPYPIFPLWDTIARSAKSAASQDHRFNPVSKKELDNIIVEVSMLSQPVRLQGHGREILKQIVVGRDGIMVEFGSSKGLLLPQVALEWGWTSQEFLEETCMKGRLPATMWKDPRLKIFKFTADIFHEMTPRGEIEKVEMSN